MTIEPLARVQPPGVLSLTHLTCVNVQLERFTALRVEPLLLEDAVPVLEERTILQHRG